MDERSNSTEALSGDAYYRLLRLLDESPALSQREIATEMGMSLGKVNYCLRALVDRGWVKAANFCKSHRKRAYIYKLTPRGLREKGTLALRFLRKREAEFEALREEIHTLRREVHTQGQADARPLRQAGKAGRDS